MSGLPVAAHHDERHWRRLSLSRNLPKNKLLCLSIPAKGNTFAAD